MPYVGHSNVRPTNKSVRWLSEPSILWRRLEKKFEQRPQIPHSAFSTHSSLSTRVCLCVCVCLGRRANKQTDTHLQWLPPFMHFVAFRMPVCYVLCVHVYCAARHCVCVVCLHRLWVCRSTHKCFRWRGWIFSESLAFSCFVPVELLHTIPSRLVDFSRVELKLKEAKRLLQLYSDSRLNDWERESI